MYQIPVTLLIILIVYLINVLWIRPIRLKKYYVREIRKLGYSVFQNPYNLFRIDFVYSIQKGMKEGDAMKQFKQKYSKYDVMVGNAFNQIRIQISNEDFIKDFYKIDKHYEYPKTQRLANIFGRAGGKGIVFSQGQVWKRKRAILNKVFNFDFVKAQTHRIAQICSYSIDSMQKQSHKNGNQVEYNILNLTTRMFSGVILQIFLGGTKQSKINGQAAGQFLKKLLAMLINQAFNPFNALLGIKYMNLGLTKQHRQVNEKLKISREWGLDFIHKRISQIQQNLKQNPGKKMGQDIIQQLILYRINKTANDKEQIQMSEKQIYQEFSTFFAAGTDTTSNFAQMMIYQIAIDPQIQRKIRDQINTYMCVQDYSYENLKNFKYIDLVQKQVTRYYGPGTQLFARYALLDNYLNGVLIKKGTRISIMNISLHYNQKYFKNPHQFRPERWESQCNDLPAYVFGGFSAGARTCLGKQLALIQSKIAIIKFFKRYKKVTLPTKNFKMDFKFTYSPENFNTKLQIDEGYKL